MRTYTTADGLAQNNVIRVVRDSHGFLWFATRDGLSRFDGYAFTTYGMVQGLPHPNVTHLVEARDGSYWISTNGGGVARLGGSPGGSAFTVYPVGDNSITNRVNVLYEDRSGTLWAGTDGELFRLEQGAFRKVDLGLEPGHRWLVVLAFAEDSFGNLWIGTSGGVFVRRSDGAWRPCAIQPSAGYDWVRALIVDREGRLWIGHYGGGVTVLDLARWKDLDAGPAAKKRCDLSVLAPAVRHRFTRASGLAGDGTNALHESADGHVWIGTDAGLSEFDGHTLRSHGASAGLPAPLASLTEDAGGNVWAATPQGALKIARSGFTTFDQADGLSGSGVRSMAQDEAGTLYVTTSDGIVHAFDGRRFRRWGPSAPWPMALAWPMTSLRDRAGEWWIATLEGLVRFRGQERPRIETSATGLNGSSVLAIHESATGDVWISLADVENPLMRWERATRTFRGYTQMDGVPDFAAASSFAEDRAGTLWVGLYDGGLLRLRERRFQHLTAADGVPAGQVTQLHVDRQGRLWIGTNASGVGRIDDPSAASPRVAMLAMGDGLASNHVTSIAEDGAGRLYLGSGRGVDRLDPASGRVVHFSEADGLDVGGVEVAFHDREGRLWFGGPRGVSRLVPAADRVRSPPPVRISGVRVPGLTVRLSEVGETELAGIEVGPDQNQVVIDFVGLGFAPGETLRYRYRLEGADADWSAPTTQRTVHYAKLAPGRYRFLVVAESASGGTSPLPAAVGFTVLPRVWQRGWFLALAAAALALAGTALYRYRVARLLEVAHMRTRIATDLHDDIGANLTKIAILAEVARQQLRPEGGAADSPLTSIARISRESVASMSDIVWAINPARDGLIDLVRRMRLHAEELVVPRGIGLEFEAPGEEHSLRLGAGTRRDLFLIFKEAVNNAARHSDCTRLSVGLRVEGGSLSLRVADDGRGFDTSRESDGQGLLSMRRRAERLGGVLEVVSPDGKGTEVRARVPYLNT